MLCLTAIPAERLFNVHTNSRLVLNNVQVLNFSSTNGGAIYNQGTLIISNCILAGNAATNFSGTSGANGSNGGNGNSGTSGGTAAGGAIYSTGPVGIYYSVVGTNTAGGGSGGSGGTGASGLLFGGNGGNGGSGGGAYGAALFTGSNNVLFATASLILALPAPPAAAAEPVREPSPAWAARARRAARYKQATDAFEKAVALEPRNSEYAHWLGKAWGRRAETSSILTAASYASKARQFFERSVMLDTSNLEALNDLFDYCMEAPGFLGGGLNRAEALVERIGAINEAEGHYAMAQLLDRRKEFDKAEEQLQRAFELAPRQVGRSIALAKYLSKLGRVQESEAAFAQAEKLTPNNPRILYERAQTYIRDNRNLAQARELLKRYINSPLTPNEPPRQDAQQLLRRVGASKGRLSLTVNSEAGAEIRGADPSRTAV